MTPFLIENQLFQQDYTILILVFVLGAIAGSFSLAFADGIIHGRKIFRRSKCNHCKKTILWAQLIPIFSYIFLKGKCFNCNKKIHFEIFIFEVYFACLYILYFLYLDLWYFLKFALISIFLAVIFETDRKKPIDSERVSERDRTERERETQSLTDSQKLAESQRHIANDKNRFEQ